MARQPSNCRAFLFFGRLGFAFSYPSANDRRLVCAVTTGDLSTNPRSYLGAVCQKTKRKLAWPGKRNCIRELGISTLPPLFTPTRCFGNEKRFTGHVTDPAPGSATKDDR